jgi:hypothetical protein
MRSARVGRKVDAERPRATFPRKERGSAQSLGERRRRVLEKREEVVAREKRGNRRRQDREKRKSSRCDADRRSSRRVTLTGSEERHDTEVRCGRVGVELFVQAGRNTEQHSSENRQAKEDDKAKSA